MTNLGDNKPLVVVSHCREDDAWRDWMRPQLDVLAQYGHIAVWDDHDIAAGQDKFFALDDQLRRAAIAVCLISADYLASPFIMDSEVNYLLERRQRDGLLLVPILVRPCVWKAVPWLKRLEMIPRDGKAVSTDFKGREDEVFAEAAAFIFDYASKWRPPVAREVFRGVEVRQPTFTEAAKFAIEVVDTQEVPPEAAAFAIPEGLRIDVDRMPETGYRLFGRDTELQALDEAWQREDVHLISLIGWGGVGKSTLVRNWLERLEADGYRGARRVFAWSFYSQGTKERVTSADSFFDEALRWFGASGYATLSAWDKGILLAKLVRQEPTLLILDGLEPLQSGGAMERGLLKDPGIKTLLQEVIRENNGLCVVTSREELADFRSDEAFTSRIDLETISERAGRALLRVSGVRGEDAELEQATEEFGGHALAVNLLGAYLHEIPGHHVAERARIPDIDVAEKEGKHARRVIAAFEELLGEGAERELLRILGLFDRPVEMDLVHAVTESAVIDGLTSHLHGLSVDQWQAVLERLRALGLIARQSTHAPDALDAHPLVREHFAEQLKAQFPEAAKEAHRRLYEHLKAVPKKDLPDTLQELMPLYHAIAHGCAAGFYQQAHDEVHLHRIRRGRENYAINKLGAFGADLAALACFFDHCWDRPTMALTERDRAILLGNAAYRLRGLGRLEECAGPMQAALDRVVALPDFEEAAISASNLSELYVTLCDVASAVRVAEQSVAMADRCEDAFRRMALRTTLADALHLAGRVDAALAAFREAEAMQAQWQKHYPQLYSVQGFRYCDLLLGGVATEVGAVAGEDPGERVSSDFVARCREVRKRAENWFEWRTPGDSKLGIALENLTFGRTYLLEAECRIQERDKRGRGSRRTPGPGWAAPEQKRVAAASDRAEGPFSAWLVGACGVASGVRALRGGGAGPWGGGVDRGARLDDDMAD